MVGKSLTLSLEAWVPSEWRSVADRRRGGTLDLSRRCEPTASDPKFGLPLHFFKCSCQDASRGFAHPRDSHSASFAKLGLAERGTEVDEGTRDERAWVP